MSRRLARSYAYCDRVARGAASNFYRAFRLLPAKQRRGMSALYAFLRIADDIGDSPGNADGKRSALEDWRERLHLAVAGKYTHRVHAALHHAISEFAIPRAYLDDVLDGVEMDLNGTVYNTFSELHRYCYRVASAVGLACIHIWGFEGEKGKELAEAAGIAFQLTNILRDLGEDLARGRVYLPQEDLNRFQVSADHLRDGRRDEAYRSLMRFQVDRAREYYAAAAPLRDHLASPGRAVFGLMSRTYQGLLDEIERRNYDVFSRRIALTSWHKVWLTAQAIPVRCGW